MIGKQTIDNDSSQLVTMPVDFYNDFQIIRFFFKFAICNFIHTLIQSQKEYSIDSLRNIVDTTSVQTEKYTSLLLKTNSP